MRRVADSALAKARRVGRLRGLLPDLALVARMLRAHFTRGYRDVSPRTIALALLTALYLLTPIDLIPDFIPVVGYLDDVVVLGFLLKAIRADLDRFADWERRGEVA
jgi:uncharacterized membrane protein YkvA (DUF1232 family)